MSVTLWSVALQWSRAGTGAVLFLLAARILPLAELGAFATAFAPVRLAQGPIRAASADAAVTLGDDAGDLSALALVTLAAGVATGLSLCGAAALLGGAVGPPMSTLSLVPILWALGAVPEGCLRRSLALRALALRSLAAQGTALAVALALLWGGAGLWALVGFALVNAALASALAIAMSAWRPSRPRGILRAARLWRGLATRELVSGLPLPMVQMLMTPLFGLPAAGAFQVAARALQLADALTLAPLRYVSLPRLVRRPDGLGAEIAQALWVGGLVTAVTVAAGPAALTVLTGAKAADIAPFLLALAPLPLAAAATMPVRQALIARQRTAGPLILAAFSVIGTAAAAIPLVLLGPVGLAAALPAGAFLAAILWLSCGDARDLGSGQVLHALPRPALATVAAVLAAHLLVPTTLAPLAVCVLKAATAGIVHALLGLTPRPVLRAA